jgi:hypothetical protein
VAERSIHRVRVTLGGETVELPRASRDALLEQLRPLDSMTPVIHAFEAVGTSRPVELSREQKVALLQAIKVWGREVEGGLPEGLFELRNALHNDLHLNLVKGTQVELFRVASQLVAQGHYGPAVVIAQAAVELVFEASIEYLLRTREVDAPLRKWVARRSTVGSWSPMNDRIEGLWEAMTGDQIREALAWKDYKASIEFRHGFAHRGIAVTQEQAEGFIDAAERLVAHTFTVTVNIDIARTLSALGEPQ